MEMHGDDDFSTAFDYASGATAERFQNPLWFVTEIFFGAKLKKAISVVKLYGDKIVASAVADRKANVAESSASGSEADKLDEISGSLIQSLLDAVGNEKMVADSALNYLSAGRDTVAQSLTWTFYLLMRNQHVTGKIRKEVQQVLAKHEDPMGSRGPDPVLFTPVTMPYTMAVFYETLRLYPPIPFEIRQCDQQTTLPDGTFLPKSAVLLWCSWAMGRSKTTFGEDADDFRPERWLIDGKFSAKSPSEFPVFNGGARTCLGKKMAEIIAIQALATLTYMFDFMPAYEGERVSKSSLTLPMAGGLPCFVRPRSYFPH